MRSDLRISLRYGNILYMSEEGNGQCMKKPMFEFKSLFRTYVGTSSR